MMVPRLVRGSPLIRFIIKYRFYEWDKVVILDMALERLHHGSFTVQTRDNLGRAYWRKDLRNNNPMYQLNLLSIKKGNARQQ